MEQYLKIGAVTFFFRSPCTVLGALPYVDVLASLAKLSDMCHSSRGCFPSCKAQVGLLSSPQSTSPSQNPDSPKMPLCSVLLWGRDSLRARTRPGDGREKAGFYNGLSSDKEPLRRWKAGRLLDVA